MKVNLGCGPRRTQYSGYVNCDKDPDLYPDVVWDVKDGLPTEWEGKADEIRAENLFDSLTHHQSTDLMRHIYRTLKPGGVFCFHCGDAAVNPAMCLGSWPYFVHPYTELFFRHFDTNHNSYLNWHEAWNLPGFINVKIHHNDNGIMIGSMQKPF
jgi:SAM-dependent methyltransferase